MTRQHDQQGRDLHRDFVGMLFALAIAEVAVQASGVVNSGADLRDAIAAYSHLILAAVTIAASWVGWGQSEYRLSNIRSLFSKHFVQLAIDLWLVALYFFLAGSVELLETPAGGGTEAVSPSLANEKKWIALIFVTYFFWDVVTKCCNTKAGDPFIQRGWASVLCAILAIVLFFSLPDSTEVPRVLAGDVALLSLVLLFRAMKAAKLSKLSKCQWVTIVCLSMVCFLATDSSVQFTYLGRTIMSVFLSV